LYISFPAPRLDSQAASHNGSNISGNNGVLNHAAMHKQVCSIIRAPKCPNLATSPACVASPYVARPQQMHGRTPFPVVGKSVRLWLSSLRISLRELRMAQRYQAHGLVVSCSVQCLDRNPQDIRLNLIYLFTRSCDTFEWWPRELTSGAFCRGRSSRNLVMANIRLPDTRPMQYPPAAYGRSSDIVNVEISDLSATNLHRFWSTEMELRIVGTTNPPPKQRSLVANANEPRPV
jgi:hypothetical protein